MICIFTIRKTQNPCLKFYLPLSKYCLLYTTYQFLSIIKNPPLLRLHLQPEKPGIDVYNDHSVISIQLVIFYKAKHDISDLRIELLSFSVFYFFNNTFFGKFISVDSV